MKLIVLDTETSDLDPDKGAKLLELAWTELEYMEQSWTPVNTEEYRIQYNGPINPHAQAAHHLTIEMLTEERGAIKRYDAILKLLQRVDSDTVFVAHNSQFDSKFFPEINRPWICTMRAAKHVWPNAPSYSNQVLRYFLKLDIVPPPGKFPHQAIYDVATTTGILLRMLEHHSPEQLLHLSHIPAKLRSIGFGKHRGSPFESIPRDYLSWLRQQSNLDEDLKYTLDSILKP